MNSTPRVLVAIANHGTKNDVYVQQLLAAYRAMPIAVDIVILSDRPKDLGRDVEVRVGAPTANPWSLPFAHRKLFIERQNDYDFFIYSEDDTLLTWQAFKAFADSQQVLAPNEIAGFMRMEIGPDGSRYYSTCHSFFRWDPNSIRERGGKLWARYTNEHAACYIVSRDQLRRAIASGGFTVEPHEGRHDMLCAAATDIYTRCGFERLVCLDELETFTLRHLPDKYIGKMGLPEEEMRWHVEALRAVHRGELTGTLLFEPETILPGGFGSKFCREPIDPVIAEALGDGSKRVLVWGAGDGFHEQDLQRRGHDVTVVPLDGVLAECCRRRGLRVLEPGQLASVGPGEFDAIILRDVLHLLPEPDALVRCLRQTLTPNGLLLARIPNLGALRRLVLGVRKPRWREVRLERSFPTYRNLARRLRAAGFGSVKPAATIGGSLESLHKATGGLLRNSLAHYVYLTGRAAG